MGYLGLEEATSIKTYRVVKYLSVIVTGKRKFCRKISTHARFFPQNRNGYQRVLIHNVLTYNDIHIGFLLDQILKYMR
jgi:hypothetical protein